jgi:hypothetical protein
MKRAGWSLLLLSTCVLPGVLSAQVMDEKSRAERLAEIGSVLEPGGPSADASGVADPFYAERAGVGAKAASASGAASTEALSDESALAAAADVLRPTGVMVGASKRFIVSSAGDLYEVGKTVRVNLPGGVREVIVDSADGDGYALRLGHARLARKYADDSGGGKSAK